MCYNVFKMSPLCCRKAKCVQLMAQLSYSDFVCKGYAHFIAINVYIPRGEKSDPNCVCGMFLVVPYEYNA